VKGKSNAVTAATDPWRDVGSGMRLDGKSTSDMNTIEGLTEEEMLQMALAASMEPTVVPERVLLTPEPPAGTAGAVRIQFRLSNGGRLVRRFLESEPVGMVYTYVENEAQDGKGKMLELRYGFPPKDLSTIRNKTIGEAELAGQAVQCRFV
jgi:ataxin-3